MIKLKEMEIGKTYRDTGGDISVNRFREDCWFKYDYEQQMVFIKFGEKDWAESKEHRDLLWEFSEVEEELKQFEYSKFLSDEEIEELKRRWYFIPLSRLDIIEFENRMFPHLFKRYLRQEFIPEVKEEIRKELKSNKTEIAGSSPNMELIN